MSHRPVKAIRGSSDARQDISAASLNHEIYELITHIKYSDEDITNLIEFVKERDRHIIKDALREYRRIHEE